MRGTSPVLVAVVKDQGPLGGNLKMPHPQCIKTYYQTTMMPKVPQRMGFYGQTPKWLHCARTARARRLRRPLEHVTAFGLHAQ